MGCIPSISKNNLLTSISKETKETKEINKIDGIKQKKEILNIEYMDSKSYPISIKINESLSTIPE
jgi:hypothetical protein